MNSSVFSLAHSQRNMSHAHNVMNVTNRNSANLEVAFKLQTAYDFELQASFFILIGARQGNRILGRLSPWFICWNRSNCSTARCLASSSDFLPKKLTNSHTIRQPKKASIITTSLEKCPHEGTQPPDMMGLTQQTGWCKPAATSNNETTNTSQQRNNNKGAFFLAPAERRMQE
jgi:hypothetical protein